MYLTHFFFGSSGTYSGLGLKITKFSSTDVTAMNSSFANSALSLCPITTGVSCVWKPVILRGFPA